MALHDLAQYVTYGDGSTTGYYAVPVFPLTTSVVAGAVYRQATTPAVGSERCFVVTTAGLTTTEPSWAVTRGALNTSGTATFQEATGVPGLCGDSTNMPTWLAYKNATVILGAVIFDSVSASYQICTIFGTSGNGATPSFSATAGTITADNTATWTSLGLASNFTTPFAFPHARIANATAANWGVSGVTAIFVKSNSAETQASAVTLLPSSTLTSPWTITCISGANAPPQSGDVTTGASVTTTGANSINIGQTAGGGGADAAFIDGIAFNAGTGASAANIVIGSAQFGGGGAKMRLENCALNLKTTSAASLIQVGVASGVHPDCILNNCTWTFGAIGQGIVGNGIVQGGTVAATGTVPTTLFTGSSTSTWIWRGVDISAITGNLVSAPGFATGRITLENCKIGSGVTMITGATNGCCGAFLQAHNCDSAATNYRYFYSDIFAGTAQQETTIIRAGSPATDGVTALSWNMTSTANPNYYAPFVSEEIAQWNSNTGVSKTADVFINTATTLNNNDLWIEVEYLGNASFPISSTVNTRAAVLAAGAALTTDSVSSWGASAKANSYKLSVTFTPQMKGTVKLRLYLAKPSVTVYVDPFIYIH